MLPLRIVLVLMLGVMTTQSMHAAESMPNPAPTQRMEASPELRMLLGGLLTEADVNQLFAHLRATMRAAVEGRQPPPFPEALARRLESAGSELQVRGLIAGMALTHFVERAVRDAVRELAPPPRESY